MIEAGARPATRPWRFVTLVVAAALGLAACSGAHGAQSSSSKDHVTRSTDERVPAQGVAVGDRCAASELSLGVANDIGTLHGSTALLFSLTNVAKRTCTVYGYPGLSLVSVARLTLLAQPGRLGQTSGFAAPATVRLAPRGRAWFVALIAGSPTLLCHAPVEAISYPPDGSKPLDVWLPINQGSARWHRIRVCAGETLSVSAVTTRVALAPMLAGARSLLRAPSLDPAEGPGPCAAGQLELSVGLGLDQVGEGVRTVLADDLMYRNRSQSACVLTGYPGIGFLDGEGHAIPVTVEWPGINRVFGDPVPHLVEPGASLVAVFEVAPVATTNIPVPGCRTPVTVESYPPNSFAPLVTRVTGKGSTWAKEWRRFGCDGTGMVVSVSRLMHPSTLAASEQAVAAGFLSEHFS